MTGNVQHVTLLTWSGEALSGKLSQGSGIATTEEGAAQL
jgi:hypothetical protein